MQARWRESNLTIARAKYYILWCTKYRRPVLDGCIQKRLKEIIYNRAKNIDSNIERLSIKEDRVEMIVSSSALNAPHYLVQQFKRISSFLLRSEFKELRSKLPSLWNRSYYLKSLSCDLESSIDDFLLSQRNN